MNPLFNALFGTKQGQIQASVPQMQNNAVPSRNDLVEQLQANPIGTLQRAGYNVPEELAGNPQGIVMHLMQCGQINSPMMQRIAPYLQRMGFR